MIKKSDEGDDVVELLEAYRGMAPEARRILLEAARLYLRRFPDKRSKAVLRLVVARNKVN